jgi:hypothetical protein
MPGAVAQDTLWNPLLFKNLYKFMDFRLISGQTPFSTSLPQENAPFLPPKYRFYLIYFYPVFAKFYKAIV